MYYIQYTGNLENESFPFNCAAAAFSCPDALFIVKQLCLKKELVWRRKRGSVEKQEKGRLWLLF